MKVILVSHGSFSKGLFETMEMVLGEQQNMSVCILIREWIS